MVTEARAKVPTKLGELLSLARELHNWSQRRLAAESGVHHAIIAQIESGYIKEPSFRIVCRLGNALGVKIERLAVAALDASPPPAVLSPAPEAIVESTERGR